MVVMKKAISGYLECKGVIVRISNIEDIDVFLSKYGKCTNDISEKYLKNLTASKVGDEYRDDCNCKYLQSPLRLAYCQDISSYKIKEGTIAVLNNACSPYCSAYSDRLKSVLIPNSVISIGQYSFACNHSLSKVILSSNLLRIGDKAFFSCYNLKDFKLTDCVEYIGDSAFRYTGLKEVVLPKSLKKLQSLAFSCCSELKTVTFKGKPEELGSSIFDRCDSLEEIFVPSGTKEYFVQALLSVDERIVIEY